MRPPATVIDVRSLGRYRPPTSVPGPSRLIATRLIDLAVDFVRKRIAHTVFMSSSWAGHATSRRASGSIG